MKYIVAFVSVLSMVGCQASDVTTVVNDPGVQLAISQLPNLLTVLKLIT
jgi:hypothetical protein